jgi:hypothetical protein
MLVSKARLVTSVVLGFAACAMAQAQTSSSTTHVSIGAKVWHADWLSYLPATYSGIDAGGRPALGDSVNAVEGGAKTDVLPQLAISHGRFFASASHGRFATDFAVRTSPLLLPTGQTLVSTRTDYLKRRESDVNLGYAVTPELSLALGYKDATETRDVSLGVAPQRTPLLNTRVRGFLLGAVGNFAVADKLRLYAQAGYGPARLKADFYDRGARLKTRGRYLIGEIGLSYPVFTTAQGMAATAALGYRTQTVKTDSYEGVFQEGRDLRDVRDGVVLSLTVAL